MTEPSPSSEIPDVAPSEPKGGLDPPSTLKKIKDLLQAEDDTSRFVGLALLKSVLDNEQLAQDSENLCMLWEAMSTKFLDRLLRSPQSENVNKADSKDMVDLAVAVLHTFTILLPESSRKEKRLTGRVGPLVKAVLHR
jgi:neurochondrin